MIQRACIAARCARAGLALAVLLAAAMLWLCLPTGWALRRKAAAAGWAVLLRGFGIRLRCHGAPPEPSGALVAANHVSWTDIAVLGRLLDAGFIAKAEVAAWPVIGLLARRYGCLFIDRNRRGAVRDFTARMRAHPARAGLILFPEGTTGDGNGLLPFRSSLFAAAGARWPAVQPVTITYRRRDGSPLSPAERRRVAWIDDDALLPHAFALAASGGVIAEVWFETPIPATDRKAAAESCRSAIAARLGQDQAAALKRAA
ncbi:MAG: 1-acyl-sn-glycerol-3-phosphate acyltransferase [Sphingomonadales bacterium]|nr:1-acyl-sn-glycerol-3-phosphate acyltransferase [Sphingomonadales bacterium]